MLIKNYSNIAEIVIFIIYENVVFIVIKGEKDKQISLITPHKEVLSQLFLLFIQQ